MSVASGSTASPTVFSGGSVHSPILRGFAWSSVVITFVYILNTYLSVWQGWPGVLSFMAGMGMVSEKMAKPPAEGALVLGAIQAGFYILSVIGCFVYSARSTTRTLRADSMAMADITNFIVRTMVWAVLLIGFADAVISFLRVEDLLVGLVGEEMTKNLGRSRFRGPYVHIPLFFVAVVIGIFSRRALAFHWLALLVVVAELFIVLSRFVFAYEQAFQADLVRFWYGALFLFASAYTLFEDGHVRVDVVYAGLKGTTKGIVNAIGAVVLGILMCWVILIFGMGDKTSIVNSALLSFEVSQSGFGMYVKYLMAAFLAVFAVTMNIQFTSMVLEGVADHRNEPGARERGEAPPH